MADTSPVLYGFSGSTYVRSVRTLLQAKGVAYDQVPVNVMTGETRQQEHLARHPFGKVPVLDIDDMRLIETEAIQRYIDETRGGKRFTPDTPKGRARMTMAMNLIDSYGYGPLLGTAGYHLFPDFLGNPSPEQHDQTRAQAHRLLDVLVENKGSDPWLAGPEISLADIHLAPILFYVSLTPERAELIDGPLEPWWQAISALPAFKATEPAFG